MLGIVVLLLLTGAAGAADGTPASPPATGASSADARIDDAAQRVAASTMSPFCPGRTLADCPSPYAAEWREEIRGWLRQGLTVEQVRAKLAGRAGRLDGAPDGSFGWLWLAAALGGSVALLALVRTLAGTTRRASTAVAAVAADKQPHPAAAEPGTTSRTSPDSALTRSLDAKLDRELGELED